MTITTIDETTCVCAWCDRVYADGAWREAEPPPPGTVTHGICEECAGDMLPVTPRAGRRFSAGR